MHVVGTAGHVDHGKSSLVRAMTGIDPDRLKEEKAREMTIDLGFAWLTLPNGEQIGIIDVPGHRDFIENMLAGVGGIDAVMFVVAADEGAMPQTREHLAIIDLLRIPTGIIALTKIDLVQDPGWLELVQLDLAELMTGTVLDGAPIIPVSARTGEGLDQILAALATQLAGQPAPIDIGRPRLWVDRVFSVSGFGTVVTGTLLDGQLTTGQEIELGGLRGRIRGLQSHQQSLEIALPGNRVAVNVSGIDRSEIRRGQLLTLPDTIPLTELIAVRFRHLPDSPRPLRNNAEVKFFCGATDTMAAVHLLDSEQLAPGAEGWLQLELRDPLPLVARDRFILRYPSPGETIGGGDVIDPAQRRRWRRKADAPRIAAQLEALTHGNPADLVVTALDRLPMTLDQIAEATRLDEETIRPALEMVLEQGSIVALSESIWISQAGLEKVLGRLEHILSAFHRAEPLRTGMNADSLRRQLALEATTFEALINMAGTHGLVTRTRNGNIARYGFTVQLSRTQRAAVDRLMQAFANAPYTPPSYKEAADMASEDVLTMLIESGELVRIPPDVLLTPAVFGEFADGTAQILASEGRITIKTFRDQFNTSRKYAQAMLEYYDNLGITRRAGDDHVVGSGAWERLGLT
jgi:selenocysteine-specific elongation factor